MFWGLLYAIKLVLVWSFLLDWQTGQNSLVVNVAYDVVATLKVASCVPLVM